MYYDKIQTPVEDGINFFGKIVLVERIPRPFEILIATSYKEVFKTSQKDNVIC